MKYLFYFFILIFSKVSLAQYKDTLLTINGTSLFVRESGNGSPIIVIHGGPGLNMQYFFPHLNTLSKKHRIIFYDQRACGNSSGDIDSTKMTLDLFIEDIEGLRKKMNLNKINILAHSWGSLLAMKYASKYSEHISHLILCNSISPKSGEFENETNKRIAGRISVKDSLLRIKMINSNAFTSGNLKVYSELLKLSFKPVFYYKKGFEKLQIILPQDFLTKRTKLFYMRKELSGYDFYNDLSKISCPTLIIHGEYDGIPVTIPQKMRQYITGSKLCILKHAGHFSFIDRHNQFIRLINQFLK